MSHARQILLAACLAAGALGPACTTFCPPGPVELDLANVEPRVDYEALDAVLSESVATDGLLITRVLRANKKRLVEQLRILAVTGPDASAELLPSTEDKLAYWYNARTAWAMYLALLADFELARPRQELLARRFDLNGRKMSLGQIDEILAGYDDPRIVASAPGVTWQRARLPVRAFAAEDVRDRIAERFEQLLDDPRRLVIDIGAREIRYPQAIWSVRRRILRDFVRQTGAAGATLRTALAWQVSGSAHRRLQDAIGYTGTARRADWSLVDLIDY